MPAGRDSQPCQCLPEAEIGDEALTRLSTLTMIPNAIANPRIGLASMVTNIVRIGR